jgi:hypothetical protein
MFDALVPSTPEGSSNRDLRGGGAARPPRRRDDVLAGAADGADAPGVSLTGSGAWTVARRGWRDCAPDRRE